MHVNRHLVLIFFKDSIETVEGSKLPTSKNFPHSFRTFLSALFTSGSRNAAYPLRQGQVSAFATQCQGLQAAIEVWMYP